MLIHPLIVSQPIFVLLILFSVCLIATITFYIGYRSLEKNLFNRALLLTVLYVFVHGLYSFCTAVFPNPALPKEAVSPFVLMYGPILYFGIVILRDQALPFWKVFLHAVPFVFFGLLFLKMLFNGQSKNDATLHAIYRLLYQIGPLSFFVYTVYSILVSRKMPIRFGDKLLIFVVGRVSLLFVSSIMILRAYSVKATDIQNVSYLLKVMMYASMLVFMLVILNYLINKMLKDNKLNQNRKTVKYERSSLKKAQLLAYQEKLINMVKKERLFLDVSLSLGSLAKKLKIPTHHLTQVFNMQLKQTFYQFINRNRIDYACRLLEDEELKINLEELAEKCGFNSKVSFNRQFKLQMGCTPNMYRNRAFSKQADKEQFS